MVRTLIAQPCIQHWPKTLALLARMTGANRAVVLQQQANHTIDCLIDSAADPPLVLADFALTGAAPWVHATGMGVALPGFRQSPSLALLALVSGLADYTLQTLQTFARLWQQDLVPTAQAHTLQTAEGPRHVSLRSSVLLSEYGKAHARLLLVDDEPIVREVTKILLEMQGYAVLSAENGQVALDILEHESQTIDLVLLDMQMPVLDGPATFERLHSLYPHCPVIMSTGYALQEEQTGLLQAGVSAILIKPYSSDELLRHIEKLLNAKR